MPYAAASSRDAAYRQLLESIRAVPGVKRATATGAVPPDDLFSGALEIEGQPVVDGQRPYAITLTPVSADHFEVLQIPVIEGRSIGPGDTAGSEQVVIIDRQMARRFWPDRSAVGQRIRTYPSAPWRTIVGVVGTVKVRDIARSVDGPRDWPDRRWR